MGELIHREAAAAPLGFTGERLTAAISGQIEIEHYHRYLLAREFCRGRDVLDVAAGEGYGTALLAQVARTVVGVEIDQASVEAAQAEFHKSNLRYERGDARALPLKNASVDVAVSFETLEHLAEQDVFLAELHRVLRPNGLLILSTPDRDVYSPIGAPPNPYHIIELTKTECQALLARHFAHSAFCAQRPLIGSVIIGPGEAPAITYERRSPTTFEASRGLVRAPYLIAFASDVSLPPIPDSFFVYRNDVDTDQQERKSSELALRAAVAELASIREQTVSKLASAEQRATDAPAKAFRQTTNAAVQNKSVQQQLRAAALRADESMQREQNALTHIDYLEGLASHSHLRAEAHESRAVQLEATLQAMRASTLWRATAPLRSIGQRAPRLSRAMGRAVRLIWWTLTFQLPRRYRAWQASRRLVFASAISDTMLTSVANSPLPPPPLCELVETPTSTKRQTRLDRTRQVSDIQLESSTEPVVSVIIATYGQVAATLACLKSFIDYPPRTSFEVIVVDDAYPISDEVSPLHEVRGIHVVRNATNLGFLRTCNAAASHAQGSYLYLLNNDTELHSGALDALVDLLEERKDAGMAGSKLLFSDGRLQEAGGILWDDASAWNDGRGANQDAPPHNYLREVDYCSGASLLIRRTLWDQLGGFDETYSPAYYEDVDLAFRMRQAGMRVLYEPRSVITHYEGVSHGTDLTQGVKAFQIANQHRFLNRWAETLSADHYPNGTHLLRARGRARHRTTILIVDHYILEPDRDAGSRSVMGIIDSFLEAGWLVKFWPSNRAYSPVYTPLLERRGIEVLDHRYRGDLHSWLAENGAELDHVLAIRPDVGVEVLREATSTTDAKFSFYGVDLHFARMRRQADLEDGNRELLDAATAMELKERRLWRFFDIVIYPSEEEAEVVRTMAPGTNAHGIIPFAFPDFAAPTTPTGARNILFVAGFAHPPNVDAAIFLIDELVPLVEAEIGPVKVTLAGSNPTDAVKALAGPRVSVTGYISDEVLAEMYATHRAAVVPLRFGAGVKGKVVEALSRGLPLVTTPTGVQGIPGLDAVVPAYNDAPSIAAALCCILTNDEAWIGQSAAQIAFARKRFSRAAMRNSILAVYSTRQVRDE